MYVERITIDYGVPCLASAARVRCQATIDRGASEIYPSLNALIPDAPGRRLPRPGGLQRMKAGRGRG